MNEDEKWMSIAIIEAKKAENEGEIPVGAVIINNNQIISKAHNQPILRNDPTAHAEVQAIRKAGKKQKNYRLVGSTLYVTLEPCMMCLGAIIHSRIQRVVYGAYDTKTGMCESCEDLINSKVYNHEILLKGGVLEINCSELLKSFFKLRR
jgi:tRNA(adenine34) deaminase